MQKYVTLPKSNPLSSYYYKDNFGGWVTSYVCHPTIFHVIYSMANCYSDKDQLADQSCVTLTTSSVCSGNATLLNLSYMYSLAEDWVLWSLTCATGLKSLAAAAEQAASDRRARRHAAATATPAGPVCPHCGRICALDFGLRRHLPVQL